MSYLSRADLKALRAEAKAGTLFAPPQVLELLDEIDRLNGLVTNMQADLDHQAIMGHLSDRRSEPREQVMAQVLTNLEGLTEVVALAKKDGA